MINQEQYERIRRALPVLQRADPQLERDFRRAAFFARIPAGRDVFVKGDRVDGIAPLSGPRIRAAK